MGDACQFFPFCVHSMPPVVALSTRSMFGVQPSSQRASSPAYGFGSGNRQQQAKVYLSPTHQKERYGTVSPGPSSYSLSPSLGKQTTSVRASSASYGFGSADRWAHQRAELKARGTPGPGTYCI